MIIVLNIHRCIHSITCKYTVHGYYAHLRCEIHENYFIEKDANELRRTWELKSTSLLIYG